MKLSRLRAYVAAGAIAMAAGLSPISTALASEDDVIDVEAVLVTSDNPDDPKYANAGANLRTGVGSLFIQFASTGNFGFLCTATVIDDRHVLTAAHCLRNTVGGAHDPVTSIIVVLPALNTGPLLLRSSLGHIAGFAVNPLYDATNPIVGAFAAGDVAVIELTSNLPANVERYDLYRDADEFGQETRHYGHGRSGTGNMGSTGGSDFFYARTGLNKYETTLSPFFGGNPLFDQLLHDFDSGGLKHNAMDWWFSSVLCGPEQTENPPWAQDGQCTTFRSNIFPDYKGYGDLEVGVAPGDSGGPGFIDGKVAGVHSFGFTHFCTGVTNGTDFSCGLNSSYGEMSGDTRVSTYADWIDDVGGAVALTPVPEPAPAASSASASSETIEITAMGRKFMDHALSRRLRTQVTYDQFIKEQSVD